MYEWRTGSAPKKIERSTNISFTFGDEEEEVADDKIDFGAVDLNIDTINSVETATDQVCNKLILVWLHFEKQQKRFCLNLKNVEIDWGDFDEANANQNPVDTIDFDIEELKNEISVEDAGVYIPTDGIAKDNDAFSLVEWVETRNLLINDLVKVKIFFWPLTIFLIILTSLFS